MIKELLINCKFLSVYFHLLAFSNLGPFLTLGPRQMPTLPMVRNGPAWETSTKLYGRAI